MGVEPLVHRMRLPSLIVLAVVMGSGCGGAAENAHAMQCPQPSVAPTTTATEQVSVDKNSVEIDDGLDYGDGPVHFTWNISKRTLTLIGKPAIHFDENEKVECLHVTGISHAGDEKDTLVVVSAHFGPQTCGNVAGRSTVYRFDGHEWKKASATAGGELHLRDDGADTIEWKLVSAEASSDVSGWTKTKTKKFPPTTPKAAGDKGLGFVKP